MPSDWSLLALLPPAAVLACEDFRTRRVSVGWLAALGGAAFGAAWSRAGGAEALACTATNGALAMLLVAGLAGWQALRGRPLRAFFGTAFGAGDGAAMLAVAPLFGPEAYVRFLLAACLAALGWWVLRRAAAVPLAGVMALTLAAYVLLNLAGLWN